MSVDRTGRDELTSVLASYLRGDMDSATVLQHLRSLRTALDGATALAAEGDRSLESIRDVMAFGLEMEQYRKVRGMAEWEWQGYRRELAFLCTDFEEEPWPPFPEEDWDRLVPFARRQVLFLLLAVGASLVASWWCLVIALVLSFAAFQWIAGEKDRARNAEVKHRNACRPFASLEEWHAHESCLECFKLPQYEASTHALRSSILWVRLSTVMQILIIAGMVGFIVVGSLSIWPLWVLLVACSNPCRLKENNRASAYGPLEGAESVVAIPHAEPPESEPHQE